MKTLESKLIVSGILFLLMIITGVILSRSGKPYGTGLVTLHKLFSIAALVVVILAFVQQMKAAPNPLWTLMAILGGVLFVAAIASGALLTGEKTMPDWISLVHKLSTPAIILVIGFTFYKFLTT